jgi:TRAP-type C4-dicarboxylate transport system permease small subunit
MAAEPSVTWFDRVSLWISRVTMLFIVVIVLVMFTEVVLRYVFAKPTLWANELSLWLGGMVYLFAGLYAMRERRHIRITALYDHVPRNVQRLFDLIALLCIIGFTVGLVVGGWPSASASFMRWERFGTAWNPPIPATMKPLVLIVTTLVCLQAVSNFLVDVRKPKAPRPQRPDAD